MTCVTIDLTDPPDRAANRSRDVDPRPFAHRNRAAISTTETDRLGELLDEQITLYTELRSPLDVVESLCLGDQLVELGKPLSIGLFGGVIEHGARVAEAIYEPGAVVVEVGQVRSCG